MRWLMALIGMMCASVVASEGLQSEDWKPHAPRQEIRPEFFLEREVIGADGKPALAIRHDRREGLDGAWRKTFPIEGGQHYRVSVLRRTSGVPRPLQSAYAQVRWTNSRGEQQRVAVAWATANRPSVIRADEPTAALDRQQTAGDGALSRRGPSAECWADCRHS